MYDDMGNRQLIGFSTNDLYYWNVSLDEKVKFCFGLGVNAIELGFDSVEDLLGYEVSEEMVGIFEKFEFISVHAPEIKKEGAEKVFEKLRFLCEKIGVKGIVLHYDTIDDFEVFDKSGLSFVIENMDSRKSCGTSVEEFAELGRKYKNLGFVLDLKHVYEHDNSMEMAEEFIEVMGDRLCHMHVSGSNKKYSHCPVCVADNRGAIERILKLGVDVPYILEGVLWGDREKLAKRELEYIRGLGLGLYR